MSHHASLSIDEHRALVEASCPMLDPVELPLEECIGAVAAADVRALVPVPAFTNSAMDGFALRAADLKAEGPTILPVAGDIPAGDTRENHLEPGTAWRIMTGAPVPEGADTVVKVEWTDHEAGVSCPPEQVQILKAPTPGANVRFKGEGVATGDIVIPAGTPLSAGTIAAAASVGVDRLLVHPRPRVLVIATGAELVAPGLSLGPGRIHDSNGLMMAALAIEAGAEVVGTLLCGDDPEEFTRLVDCAPEADLVITAGGVSQGAFEVVRLAIADRGRFHHVAQQPGGPQGVGLLPVGASKKPTLVLCLPGNPVSVFVSFHVYVAGLIARLAGRVSDAPGATAPRTLPGIAAKGWRSPAGKTQFVPVRPVDSASAQPSGAPVPAAGEPLRAGETLCAGETLRADGDARRCGGEPILVEPVHILGSGSHLTASLAVAEFLAVIGPEHESVAAGDTFELIPILGRNSLH